MKLRDGAPGGLGRSGESARRCRPKKGGDDGSMSILETISVAIRTDRLRWVRSAASSAGRVQAQSVKRDASATNWVRADTGW